MDSHSIGYGYLCEDPAEINNPKDSPCVMWPEFYRRYYLVLIYDEITDDYQIEVKLNREVLGYPDSYRLSGLINDGNDMTEYITELMKRSQYMNYFEGSIEGIVFEWTLHNIIFDKTSEDSELHERCRSVDLGPTIYHDNHGYFKSGIMWLAYSWLYPENSYNDLEIYLSQ